VRHAGLAPTLTRPANPPPAAPKPRRSRAEAMRKPASRTLPQFIDRKRHRPLKWSSPQEEQA
jgi:hypothetical protein